MGNKAGGKLLTDTGKPIDLAKTKLLLGKIDSIFSGQKLHYILLRFANPAWAELDLSQADCAYIFSKLRMTAKQFASTLNEAATAGIHMKGDGNIFSYYSLGDFCLILHRSIDNPKFSAGLLAPGSSATTADGGLSSSSSSSPSSSISNLSANSGSGGGGAGGAGGPSTTGGNGIGGGPSAIATGGGLGSSSYGHGITSPGATNPANLTAMASTLTSTTIRVGPANIDSIQSSISSTGLLPSPSIPLSQQVPPQPSFICNDGSHDLEKEQQLQHVMKQLYELLNPSPDSSSSSSSMFGPGSGRHSSHNSTGSGSTFSHSRSTTTVSSPLSSRSDHGGTGSSSGGGALVSVKVSAATSPAASRSASSD